MKQAYITALSQALLHTNSVEEVLNSTHALMAKKGHTRLWPAVLRGVVATLEKMAVAETPVVTVAKEGKVEAAELAKALTLLAVKSESMTTQVDAALIGGFTVQYKGLVLDKSYKRALVEVYRKVTK